MAPGLLPDVVFQVVGAISYAFWVVSGDLVTDTPIDSRKLEQVAVQVHPVHLVGMPLLRLGSDAVAFLGRRVERTKLEVTWISKVL
ncbi:hypothetical protein HC256_007131 [Beauveria bassiana]|nr:hypothetical protein HC256_007131 [Beauveria bassiana]